MAAQLSTVPTVFNFGATQIRTLTDDQGQAWFAAVDVCKSLEIKWQGAKTLARIKDEWRGVGKFPTPSSEDGRGGGEQEIIIINEPAVYKLAFRSHKEEAERFTDWLAGEVLPAIRKTGRYEAHPASTEAPRLEDWHSKAIAGAIAKRVQDRLGGKNETRAHRAGRSYCYAKLQRRFGVISTHNIAARDFDEAMRYIECMALEGEWLPSSKRYRPALAEPASPLSGWRFLCTFAEDGQPQFMPVAKDAFVIPASELRDMVSGAMQHFVQGVKLLAGTEYKYELDKLAAR